QVDVAEKRGDHRPLAGSTVSYGYDSAFEDARLEPFTDQADDALVANAVFQEADQPILADAAEEVPDIGVKYVVHSPTGDRHRQSIQRIVRPSPGSEPVWEPEEILLVDGVEHHDAGALDDLVLQSCDRQRPLPTIRLRYLRPARPFLPLRSPA